jgi:hypothetical protein
LEFFKEKLEIKEIVKVDRIEVAKAIINQFTRAI